MLRLSSRKCRDRRVAVRHHGILVALCKDIGLRVRMQLSFEEAVRQALRCILVAHSVQQKDLGLRLCLSFWAHRFVNAPLTTPTFRLDSEEGVERALSSWRRLQDARATYRAVAATSCAARRGVPPSAAEEASWKSLRELFLDIQAPVGGSDREVCALRLQRRQEARALTRERVAEKWHRQQMAAEEEAQRQALRRIQREANALVQSSARVASFKLRMHARRAVLETRNAVGIVGLLARLARIESRRRPPLSKEDEGSCTRDAKAFACRQRKRPQSPLWPRATATRRARINMN